MKSSKSCMSMPVPEPDFIQLLRRETQEISVKVNAVDCTYVVFLHTCTMRLTYTRDHQGKWTRHKFLMESYI